jgi:hypothetical protein
MAKAKHGAQPAKDTRPRAALKIWGVKFLENFIIFISGWIFYHSIRFFKTTRNKRKQI